MTRRLLVIAVLLFVSAAARSQLAAVELAPAKDLELLPLDLEEWRGRSGPPFDPAVEAVLRVDDYINRIYYTDGGAAGLYVGYHRSQQFGATIHSPLNCLPGAGWLPVSTARTRFGSGAINRVIIQKGDERQVVLYWYHTARRLEGNEYLSKLHLVTDAFTSRRNDAALVRVVAPIDPRRADGEETADRHARRLAELVAPHVGRLLFR